jgi:N-acetylglucosaminyldiphosphoundecaprenol N-acetyl-beta-D-mannosaminyltransferase
MDRPTLFDIPIDNVHMDEAVGLILARMQGGLGDKERVSQVSFVNADCVNIAARNKLYRQVLQSSNLVFADGIGMRIAGRCLGVPIVDNVNGTDLFPQLLTAAATSGLRVFLLGGRPGIAAAVQSWIERNYPHVTVVGVEHGYFGADEEDDVIKRIAASDAQLLLVAFGAPRQEEWIQRNRARLGVPVAIGVGGLFDYYSGRIPRAPLIMRKCGLEWCWRWYQEPRRLTRRYLLGNPLFLLRVLGRFLTKRQPAGPFPDRFMNSTNGRKPSPASR